MSKIKKLFRALVKPERAVYFLNHHGFHWLFSDKVYLNAYYKREFGKKLNLKTPQTFNEKLQWLKIYDRKPEYTAMVDKYEAKRYVSDILGEEYVIPTLGVYNKFSEIDFNSLPNQFVLKTTHDSGTAIICKDKSTFDLKKAEEKVKRSLKRKYFIHGREWPYKNVKPRIIVEKYMVDESGYDLKDYKFFCFDGKVKMYFVERDRAKGHNGHMVDFFDENMNHLDLTVDGYPNSEPPYFKPDNFDKMKEFAEKLSTGIPHARIDFYNVNGQVYFGEITFFHASGMAKFDPEEWHYTLGSWINLPTKK